MSGGPARVERLTERTYSSRATVATHLQRGAGGGWAAAGAVGHGTRQGPGGGQLPQLRPRSRDVQQIRRPPGRLPTHWGRGEAVWGKAGPDPPCAANSGGPGGPWSDWAPRGEGGGACLVGDKICLKWDFSGLPAPSRFLRCQSACRPPRALLAVCPTSSLSGRSDLGALESLSTTTPGRRPIWANLFCQPGGNVRKGHPKRVCVAYRRRSRQSMVWTCMAPPRGPLPRDTRQSAAAHRLTCSMPEGSTGGGGAAAKDCIPLANVAAAFGTWNLLPAQLSASSVAQDVVPWLSHKLVRYGASIKKTGPHLQRGALRRASSRTRC